jgi:hypothetical protein
MADGIKRYKDWIARRAELWTHVHLALVAFQVDGHWFSFAGRLTAATSAVLPPGFEKPVFDWEGACRIVIPASIDLLPTLVDDISRGVIPAGRIPDLDRDVRFESPVGVPFTDDGASETTAPGMRSYNAQAWLRFDARLRGAEISKLFPSPQEAYESIERVSKISEGMGHGSLVQLCADLGLRDLIGTVNGSSWAVFRFEAPLPFRLLKCGQDDERKGVFATVEIPETVPRTQAALTFRQPGYPPRTIPLPAGGPRVHVTVAESPPVGDAEVILTYAGEKVSSDTVEVRPPLRTWPMLVAVAALDRDLNILKEGLRGIDAMRYERSVAHLLGLIGFSTMWWGPNMKQKSLPLPKDAPDVILCSNDHQIVIVVECTIDEPPDKKLRLLVDRTRGVDERLGSALGADRPLVRALLALARPRGRVPDDLIDALQTNGAGLLALDDGEEILALVEKGTPRRELGRRFEALFAFQGMPIFVAD